MRCPKCQSAMGQVEYEGVVADRCSFCKGLWFDAGERDALRDKSIARDIDTGDSRRGKQTNAIDRYSCPRCAGGMVRMVDASQPHIWYEQCISCSGSFFDAGEFRDLSERTLSDFWKRLTAQERP